MRWAPCTKNLGFTAHDEAIQKTTKAKAESILRLVPNEPCRRRSASLIAELEGSKSKRQAKARIGPADHLMPSRSDRPQERASGIRIKRSCWESGEWKPQAPDKQTAAMEPSTHRSSTDSRPSRGRKALSNHDPLWGLIRHLERGQPLRLRSWPRLAAASVDSRADVMDSLHGRRQARQITHACCSAVMQKGTKKPPVQVAFPSSQKQINCSLYDGNRMFYLASSYFRRGLPPNYRRRCCVSRPSSRWIGVGPQRHGHQDRNILR